MRCGAILVASLMSACGATSAMAVCEPDSVYTDPSQANSGTSGFLGHSPGESFLARDTLVAAIVVWRDSSQWNSVWPMKLWIVKVDSVTGIPNTDPNGVILEGATITAAGTPGYPTEMRWVLDPPVALPSRSVYAFFVQNLCDGFFRILADTTNTYPDGIYWITGRSDITDCHLRNARGYQDYFDLVFTIVFCHDESTPVRRSSWGRIKTLYR
jgi:hypothetical protein